MADGYSRDMMLIFSADLCGGLPFPVLIPNEVTQGTLNKSRRGEDIETFESLDELFESWEK